MTILAGITWLQSQLRTITGIKSAPDYPGGGILPIIITHLDTGDILPGNPLGANRELNQIMVELHVSQGGNDTESFKVLETLHPLVVAKLISDYTLNGNVDTFENVTFSTLRGTLDAVPVISRIYTLNNVKVIS
ncbi:MAG: hypothetical protein UW18_C0011G0023 [Microgenomates group bacterium GW2011_GWF1_44_10]|nr:MAG: hypothetical protein UW18_C0011G0023 [Microgenomates group bacterium GW2011_GWF1_44_10]